MKTINDYFYGYEKNDIEDIIEFLSPYEKEILCLKFGKNLDTYNKISDKKISDALYKRVLPKMRWYLSSLCKKYSFNIKLNIDLEDKILSLCKENKTTAEICNELNITSEELYTHLLNLRNNGVKEIRKYYSDGTMKIIPSIDGKLSIDMSDNRNRTLITDVNENNMKLLIMSDLHFGNESERIDLIEQAFDYCIKNSIHIILCGGDFIDGSYSKGIQTISDLAKQVEYFINNYPHDKSILTFGVGGDHDLSILKRTCYDITKICEIYRPDIIIPNYGSARVKLKNDIITMKHVFGYKKIDYERSSTITLQGHFHKYKPFYRGKQLFINLPTLSNIMCKAPTVLEMDLEFVNGYIENVFIKQIGFEPKQIVYNERLLKIMDHKKLKIDEILNQEIFREELHQEGLSRVLSK